MALVALSALPSSSVVASSDISPFVISGTTKKMTVGSFRTSLFAIAATDPLSCGALTVSGNASVSGSLSTTSLAGTTMTGDLKFTDASFDIGKSGLTRPRDAFFSRNVTAGGTLSVTSTITGSAGINGLFFTLDDGTYHQTNILSAATGEAPAGIKLGGGNTATNTVIWPSSSGTTGLKTVLAYFNQSAWFSALEYANVASGTATLSLVKSGGVVSIGGSLSFTATASKIIPGVTSISHRNNADSADNLLISDAGVVTVRAGITLTAGNLVLNSGVVNASALAGTAQFIGGTTGTSIRNNANSLDNLVITDAGNATIRGTTTMTGGVAGNLILTSATSKIIPGATQLAIRNNADSANNFNITDAGTITTRGGFSINSNGSILMIAGTTGTASLNMPPGVAPTSPVDGDMWYDGTNVKFRVGITTKTFTLT